MKKVSRARVPTWAIAAGRYSRKETDATSLPSVTLGSVLAPIIWALRMALMANLSRGRLPMLPGTATGPQRIRCVRIYVVAEGPRGLEHIRNRIVLGRAGWIKEIKCLIVPLGVWRKRVVHVRLPNYP